MLEWLLAEAQFKLGCVSKLAELIDDDLDGVRATTLRALLQEVLA